MKPKRTLAVKRATNAVVAYLAVLLMAAPVRAQDAQDPATKAAVTAKVGTGLVGRRQSAEEAAPNIKPTGRIESRIDNRIQNRIRNRLDRYYDPTANATSPFKVASEKAATAGKSH